MCYCIYMDKRPVNTPTALGDKRQALWKQMENARDNESFTLLCEEAVRVGLVKSM